MRDNELPKTVTSLRPRCWLIGKINSRKKANRDVAMVLSAVANSLGLCFGLVVVGNR